MENSLFFHWVNPQQLLVVNQAGALRCIYTPFRLRCTVPVGHLLKNSWVVVEEVRGDGSDRLLYLVQGQWLPHHCFTIDIKF